MDELKPLDPKKRTTKKVFRQLKKKEAIEKPEKKPFFTEFPEKTKTFLENLLLFIKKHAFVISVIILALLIILFSLLSVKPQLPKANFIDSETNEFIAGYVYMDDNLLGSTSGEKFKLPKEYCKDSHTIKLESFGQTFEWQTYPIDCKSRKVFFYVDHEEAQPSNNIIFNFLDKTGTSSLSGELFINNVSITTIDGNIVMKREDCKNITNIKLRYKLNVSEEWEHNPSYCDEYDEIDFKIS